MTHKRLIDKYKELIGVDGKNIAMWYNNGTNSVWIRLINKKEYIFTYFSKTKWKLETIGIFKETMVR